MRIQRWLTTSVPQRKAPHFRRTGENFPQARKSDIMYLGGVTLHIHAKATTPMHAKLKHQVSCRSRRCRKKFPTHPARRGKGVCVPLHTDKVPNDRRKVKILTVRPEKWPWGPPWNQLSLVDQVPNYPKKIWTTQKKNQLRLKQGSKTPSDKND